MGFQNDPPILGPIMFAVVIPRSASVPGREASGLLQRRFGREVERRALAVTHLSAALVFASTTYIASISPIPFDDILFDTISACLTVGLSTGITAELPPGALLVLVTLMFVTRVRTITMATALALGGRNRPYRYPQENPIVG